MTNTSVSDDAIAALRQQLAPPRGKLWAIGKQQDVDEPYPSWDDFFIPYYTKGPGF